MNKNIFFFVAFFSILALVSCNKTQKPDSVKAVAETVLEKESKESTPVKNSAAEILAKPEIPILCFHRIQSGIKSEYALSPEAFNAQIQALADSGYHSISPDQLYNYLVYNKSLPTKPFMITFDDSRIEHFNIAVPTLEEHGFRGVFFIMTITYDKKNYMTKEQITQLSKAGHTIGLHSWDHTMATKYKEAADWTKQVTEPKTKLAGIVGKNVDYWAYPNGVYNHQAAEELSKSFKISFILSSKRDSIQPLQSVRRMIVPGWSPQSMLKAMHRTFKN